MVEQEKLSLSESTRDKFVRGNENRDYTIYNRSMDAALQAKAESLFPHFGQVEHGAVVVGKGSGTGTLEEFGARYFRGAIFYGLDISHELLDRAEDGRAMIELVFGDAAEKNFPSNFVDVAFFSTSGHEVESYGGRGRMTDAVEVTYDELKPGGRIVIRDFAKPTRKEPVYMQILTLDGFDDPEEATDNGFLDYSLLSTRALFDRFHAEFAGGDAFDYEVVTRDEQEYIKLAPEWAHEFYLRKDYTANWRQEIHEKYTYWTEEDAKRILADKGYMDVEVDPDPNKYIIDNRLTGQIALFEEGGDGDLRQIDFPPTHMVVVGRKPESAADVVDDPSIHHEVGVDYDAVKETIGYDDKRRVVTIGEEEFSVSETKDPVGGAKKVTYWLTGEPKRVLKTARTDALNDHAIFKALYQSIAREGILRQFGIPHPGIIEADPKGPPYRYYVQEAIPEGSQSAADLIKDGALTETDVEQLASYVNRFELGKQWQLDTNPFNWYRVPKDDGTTEMTYVDGKVYRYDEMWEFKRIGLLQWTTPEYVSKATERSAAVPKVKEYEELEAKWKTDDSEVATWWKKHLHSSLQPGERV